LALLQHASVYQERYISNIQILFFSIYVTEFGLKVKQYVNKGQLVPDELMISLIRSELGLLGNNNWILDGK
jgi:hypothetical protein